MANPSPFRENGSNDIMGILNNPSSSMPGTSAAACASSSCAGGGGLSLTENQSLADKAMLPHLLANKQALQAILSRTMMPGMSPANHPQLENILGSAQTASSSPAKISVPPFDPMFSSMDARGFHSSAGNSAGEHVSSKQ